MLVAPALADSVHGGDATGRLVGSFDAELNGHFVDVEYGPSGATIAFEGDLVVEMPLEAPSINGPLADFGNLQVHDNLYGWVHIQGDARIQATAVEPIARGLLVDERFLVGSELEWSHEGGWLTINATDVLISNDGGFQNLGPEPSAWALLQGGDNPVMDWFAFRGAPFATESIGAEVVMNLVGTIGVDAPDVLVRFETQDHFAPRDDRFVFRAGSLAAASVPADDMLLPKGGFSFHARTDVHQIIDMRLPEGLSGQVRWQQDLTPPRLESATTHNVTPYAPSAQVPELITTWSEPVWLELDIGQQTKVATHAAQEVRFRLTGLQPETTYEYTLNARDLGGNELIETGTLVTGSAPMPGGTIVIDAVDVGGDGGTVSFFVTLPDGSSPAIGLVHVFINKSPADDKLWATSSGFAVDVPADARELRIEVNGPEGRISEVLTFEDDEGAPAPFALLLLALVALARRR